MIDFDRLVLAPCQTIFGKAATIMPLASMPGAPPYIARGIWKVHAIDVQIEDGSILSSQVNTLGVRLADFPVFLKQGDRVRLDQAPADLGLDRGGVLYVFDDDDPDGQGATDVTLKEIRPDGSAVAP